MSTALNHMHRILQNVASNAFQTAGQDLGAKLKTKDSGGIRKWILTVEEQFSKPHSNSARPLPSERNNARKFNREGTEERKLEVDAHRTKWKFNHRSVKIAAPCLTMRSLRNSALHNIDQSIVTDHSHSIDRLPW